MASIVSTTRPNTITNGSNVNSSGTTSSSNIYEDAVRESNNRDIATSYKQPSVTPTVNQFSTSIIRQQAIKPDTVNSTKPEVVYENRYLNNATNVPTINSNSTLTNSNRSDLSILTKWAGKLKATNNSNQVTTYIDDPASVPLVRRDTSGFFNVDYNTDGTYHVTTTGVRIPFTDTVVGNYDLGNYSWNPMKAYAVAYPIGTYLGNYKYYDTKNKIIQGTLAFSNAYSNYYDGTNNFVDNYAIKEWGNLVDMSVNWKNRNVMQNAVTGLGTITGLAHKYGYDNYLGGSTVVQGVNDVLAMYTFGSSVYNLGKYWGQMSTSQKVGATLSTINSGVQAYQGLNTLAGLYNNLMGGATAGAAEAGGSAVAGSVAGSGTEVAAEAGGSAAGAGAGAAAGSGAGTEVAAEAGGSAAAGGSVLGAATAGYSAFTYGKTMGQSDTESGIGGGIAMVGSYYGDPYSMSAVFAYQSIKGFCENGRSTASNRKSGAAAGAASGATIGSCFGPIGTVVGAAVGAVIGTISQSGKFGRSREAWHRSLYRDSLTDVGIFEKFDKSSSDLNGKTVYQLSDGNYYHVGEDGKDSRARDINGNVKTFYNKNLIADGDKVRDSGELNPYDIDYTCNMDYTGSLLLAPLNALGLGGSNTRESNEYSQMLGYMTNAVTSNVGRDFTKENFTKMVDNIKAGYERVGINNKEDALASIGLSYMMGRVTDDDYDSYKLALDMLYDNNGYNRAQTLMDQLNRGGQAQPEPIEVTTANTGETPAEPTEGDNLIEKESSPVETTQPSEETQTIVSETESWNNTNTPTPEMQNAVNETESWNNTSSTPAPEEIQNVVNETESWNTSSSNTETQA